MAEKYKDKYRIPSARLQTWDYSSEGIYFVTICTQNRRNYFGEIVNGQVELSEIGKIVESEWLKTFDMRPDMNLIQDEYVVMPNHFHAIIIIGENEYNSNICGDGGDVQCRDAMHCVSTVPVSNSEPESNNVPVPNTKHVANSERVTNIAPVPNTKHESNSEHIANSEHVSNNAPVTNTIHVSNSEHVANSEHETNDIVTNKPISIGNDTNTNDPQNKFGPQSKNLASIIRGFKIGVTVNARKIESEFAWQPRFHDHIIRNNKAYEIIRNYIIQNPQKWEGDKFYN